MTTGINTLGTDLIQWLSMPHMIATFLIFCRVTGLFIAAPFFNHSGFPVQLRLWFALATALIFYLTVNVPSQIEALSWIPMDLPHLLPFILKELILGLVLGITMKYVLDAFHLAGETLSMQMGLSIANALDPSTGMQAPIIGGILSQYALILFVCLGMHHWVLLALHSSFDQIPLHLMPDVGKMGILCKRMLLVSAGMFSTGLMLAAPIQATLFMVEVALGYVSKLMPQMNIFMVAAPLKLMIGMWGLFTFLPIMSSFMTDHYNDHIKILRMMLNGLL